MPKRAKTSFRLPTTEKNKVVVRVGEGQLYADDHPAVKAYPHLFEDGNDAVAGQAEAVERATAAPGEKRGAKKS